MDDGFWLDRVRLLGGNQAPAAYSDIESLIRSGDMNERQLRSLSSALRSLSQLAGDKAAEAADRRKRPWVYK